MNGCTGSTTQRDMADSGLAECPYPRRSITSRRQPATATQVPSRVVRHLPIGMKKRAVIEQVKGINPVGSCSGAVTNFHTDSRASLRSAADGSACPRCAADRYAASTEDDPRGWKERPVHDQHQMAWEGAAARH
jgi:hypothetical protein